jgi:HK97 family phage portal protein
MSLVDSVLGGLGYRRVMPEPPRKAKAPRSREIPDFVRNSQQLSEYQTDVTKLWKYAERYTRSPMDYAAVGRIVDAIAMAGVNNLRVFPNSRPWDETSPLPDHLLYELLRSPGPELTQFELFEAIAGWSEVMGTSYVYIHTFEDSLPASLWPLVTPYVEAQVDRNEGLRGYIYTVNGTPNFLPTEQVMCVKRWNPFDPYIGLASSESVMYSTASDLAMLQYNWGWFMTGARPSIVIESESDTANLDEVETMKEEFIREYTGDPSEMQKPVALWGGFKVKEYSKGPKDSDFVQGRKTNMTDILAARGVHPALVVSEDVNRANAETAEYFFAKYAIAPRLARIAAQFNHDLMPMYRDDTIVRFVDVIPDDAKAKAVVNKVNAETLAILVKTLGPEEGLKEAQRQGAVSQQANIEEPEPEPEPSESLPLNEQPAEIDASDETDTMTEEEIETLKAVATEYVKAAEIFGKIRRAT